MAQMNKKSNVRTRIAENKDFQEQLNDSFTFCHSQSIDAVTL